MRPVKIAAIAAAGVLGLSGCAQSDPQVAAYVGGTEIPVNQVKHIAAVYAESTQGAEGEADKAGDYYVGVTNLLVRGALAKQAVAAEAQLEFDDTMRAAAISPDFQPLMQDPVSAEFVRAAADFILLQQTEAGQQALSVQATGTQVKLNPRFGTWDASSLAISTSGSLSVQRDSSGG